MTSEQLECKRLYFEALSKIPKRFIDGKTQALDWSNEMVALANPKYAPMIYRAKTRKWHFIRYPIGSKNLELR